jgi:4-hydroxy-tetrahydrodipicolinate synthase
MFDVDGALVGYGCIAPEPLLEMIAAGKAKDYAKARCPARPPAAGDEQRLSPRIAHGRQRRAQVGARRPRHPGSRHRAPAVASLADGAQGEIAAAMKSAGLGRVDAFAVKKAA